MLAYLPDFVAGLKLLDPIAAEDALVGCYALFVFLFRVLQVFKVFSE